MIDHCPICKEYRFGSSHKCAPLWHCLHAGDVDDWPDADIMMEDGWQVYAHQMVVAATDFAARYCGDSAWYPSELEVYIMADKINERNFYEIHKITVRQEATPWYWTDPPYEKREVAAI